MKMYGSPSGVAADRYKTAARFAEEGSYTVVAADKAGNKSAAYMFVIADMLRLGLLPVLVVTPPIYPAKWPFSARM